ncbi:hypothetical protein VNO78_32631 [Psophocarpus tetragonolobus]|uniref:Uncharacterized protein n=1 Tax=Psophocarpus tetragonolobus TaxID=3891 RepID=A0AAN9RPL3_PSOTE
MNCPLSVCAVSGVWENVTLPLHLSSHLLVRINDSDRCVSCMHVLHNVCISDNDHIFMFNLQARHMNSDIERAFKTNEWIHGTVSFEMKGRKKHSHSLGLVKWIGVYVNRAMGAISRMRDVRFTQPCPPNNTSDVGNKLMVLGEASDIQQQQQSLTLFKPKIQLSSEFREQPLNYEPSNSDLQERTSTIDVSSQASDNVTIQQGRPSEKETTISESGDKPSQSKKTVSNLSVPQTQKKNVDMPTVSKAALKKEPSPLPQDQEPTLNKFRETSISSSEEEQQVLEASSTTTQKSKVVYKSPSFEFDPVEKGSNVPTPSVSKAPEWTSSKGPIKEPGKEHGLSESSHAKYQTEVESSKGVSEHSPIEIDDYVKKLDDDPFALLDILSREVSTSSKQSETSVQQSWPESLTTVLDELRTLAFSQPMLKNMNKVEYREQVLETTKKLDKFVEEIDNDLKMRIDSLVALFNEALENCQQRASTIEKIDKVEEEKKEALEKLQSSKEKVAHLNDNIAKNRPKVENSEKKHKEIKEKMKKLQEEYDDLDKEKATIESANTKCESEKAEILESAKYISTYLGSNFKQHDALKRDRVKYDTEFASLKKLYKKMKYNPPFKFLRIFLSDGAFVEFQAMGPSFGVCGKWQFKGDDQEKPPKAAADEDIQIKDILPMYSNFKLKLASQLPVWTVLIGIGNPASGFSGQLTCIMKIEIDNLAGDLGLKFSQ